MAISKCSNCDSTYFEIASDKSPSKSNYKLSYVQCSKCGSVIGVLEYYNIGTLIKDLEKQIKSSSHSSLRGDINTLNHNMGNLFNLVQANYNTLNELSAKISKL